MKKMIADKNKGQPAIAATPPIALPDLNPVIYPGCNPSGQTFMGGGLFCSCEII